MGLTDTLRKLMPRAEKTAGEHQGDVRKAVDEAGDLADKATHDKHGSEIHAAEQKADEAIGGLGHAGEGAPEHPHEHEGHEGHAQ